MSTMQHSVSINLEILSDTLRHMASSLPYNKTARWLHGMDSHIRASKAESLNWAISMVRLGSQEDLSKHLVDDMYHAHINIPTTTFSWNFTQGTARRARNHVEQPTKVQQNVGGWW